MTLLDISLFILLIINMKYALCRAGISHYVAEVRPDAVTHISYLPNGWCSV